MSDDILRMLRKNDERLSLTEVKEVGRTNYGPTKPSSWPISVPFFDQTSLYWVIWDGTRWLTADEYDLLITPQISNTVAFDTAMVIARDDGYHAYWTYAAVQTFISPTNDGSNFWTIALEGVNNAISATTTLASFTTAALAAGGNYTALGISTPEPANHPFVRAHVTKTGAPSAIALTMTGYYRLVIP